MHYILGILVAIIFALGGVASCEHKKVISLETSIEANKIESKRLLEQAAAQGQADAISSQKDYDDAIKTLSDTNRKYVGQLRDPGRRNSCPSPAAAVAGISQDAAAGSELSEAAGAFLRGEADRADIAAVYAAKCRDYAMKPSLREQVTNMRKGSP